MTTVYFVRHAQPNYENHDDLLRELTEKGRADSLRVTEYLQGKEVDFVYSSPYLRAVDTVRDFAKKCGLEITLDDGFKERKIDDCWIDDWAAFTKRQWADFDYKLSGGESLREVQRRNIAALERILKGHEDKTIVIGSHGTALGTVLNFYDKRFGYEEFLKIVKLMPWVVRLSFDGLTCKDIQPCFKID